MRVLFAGSPEIAIPSLKAIHDSRHDLVGVLTNPESVKGRGMRSSGTPVALAAASLDPDMTILTLESLGAAARELVAVLKADILVSFAYGRIFGPKFLALFPKGGVNVHPSLLPRHRGCAPIPFSILERDSMTGVSIQRLALEMDCGDILSVESCLIAPGETTESLSHKAADTGSRLLIPVLDAIEEGKERSRPQEGLPTYTRMLTREDGRLDWSSTSLEIDAKVRAFNPWPGVWTGFRGKKLAILESFAFPGMVSSSTVIPGTILGLDRARGLMVQTKDGAIALTRLQLPARKPLSAKDFVNGTGVLDGVVLGLDVTPDRQDLA